MRIEVLATTSTEKKEDMQHTFNVLSGEFAGICYMPDNFANVVSKGEEKSLKRAEMTKQNGHHSVFDHEYITLLLEDVPKLFAMLLNNEKVYTTSEKSARYTKMKMDGLEVDLYQKWVDIFTLLITQKYGKEEYFDAKRIVKLAQENARYFLSIFTPTTLAYTVSYRQLNYLYSMLKSLSNTNDELLKKTLPTIKDFCKQLEDLKLIDLDIAKFAENREFSLISKKQKTEYFGDVYVVNYLGSFAQLAQAQRHRTLNYDLKQLDQKQYYIPKLIENDEEFKQMWLEDMKKVADLTPQGELVQICERGTPEALILKLRERLCTCAQLEICDQTKDTLQKYINNTNDEEVKKMLEPYNKGARCVGGYKCASPCKFADGITLEREI